MARLLMRGVIGDDVMDWQEILVKANYDIDPDGNFGTLTHNATVSWQKERGLVGDGVVGQATWASNGKTPSTLSNPLEEDDEEIKFVQAKNYTWADRKVVDWIVLHSMEASESSTTAENVASWFASKSAPRASAHYNIDDDSIVQSVKEGHVAWHGGGGNKRGIGLEHAGYARQSEAQWLDSYSTRMLKRSAKLTAGICKRWNIPVKYVDREGLKRGERGITTHNEITFAFRKSTHTDPGKHFPMDQYLEWVNEAMCP